MENDSKTTVSAAEIEEKVVGKQEEPMDEEGPSFAPLSAQDLAVSLLVILLIVGS